MKELVFSRVKAFEWGDERKKRKKGRRKRR